MRLLIVEDENLIREQLRIKLGDAGFVVDVAQNGREGLVLAEQFAYDAAVIDLGLPELDGVSLIQTIRAHSQTFPILILTARDAWQDKVEGLEAGADDYVTKPFHMEEILARINALLRRSAGFAHPVLNSGDIALNTQAKSASLAGAPVELTAYEYKVLEYLMLNPDKVVSKTELTEHIYAQDYDRDSNVIEVFVGRLRKKLATATHPQPIKTIRGQGYRFNGAVDATA